MPSGGDSGNSFPKRSPAGAKSERLATGHEPTPRSALRFSRVRGASLDESNRSNPGPLCFPGEPQSAGIGENNSVAKTRSRSPALGFGAFEGVASLRAVPP